MKARLAVAAGIVGLLALTGCGSGGSSSPTIPTFSPTVTSSAVAVPTVTVTATVPPFEPTLPATATTAPRATVVPECTKTMLTATLPLATNGAGSTFQPIEFTNVSGSTCQMMGYPGVSAVNASLAQLGVPAVRVTRDLHAVTLNPGQHATATLQIVNALNFPVSSCGTPKQSAFLRIIPPDATSSFYDSFSAPMCVTPLHILFIGPVT